MEIKDKKTVTEVTLTLTAEEFRALRLLAGSVGGSTQYSDVDLFIPTRSESNPTGVNGLKTSHANRLLVRELCSKIYNHEA